MKPARISKQIRAPKSWHLLANGAWARELIQARLDEWCPRIFGYHFLKLGGLSCELLSHHCNVPHHIQLDTQSPYRNLTAELDALPFIEKSIDACLLVNQLEYSADPHRLLREIDRVLIDDGYLLIAGFNPISLYGLTSLLPWKRKNYPWCGRRFSPYRVKDWLGVLNYEVIHHESFAVLPATRHEVCWAWAENMLVDYLSSVGCMYFIVARKRTSPLKPIKPGWLLRRRIATARVNVRSAGRRAASLTKLYRQK
ncbi:methyltransferase domain-containing protein [Thaumasiovibrio sp. DFM-14]|uniref:methyltransferase domain-containing protein n=1 Tax=Thaumasiovibrio sp. DFM-14 TaxID=3384792 RepID=UPI0039A3AB8E